MQDLTPVGLDADGTRLVLVSASGEEFTVPVDTRLREAMRGGNARLGQLETKMDSALRPRDIQARIRAGETPEDVAAAAKTTVDAIMPFAGPVIAERQHVAQSALKGSLRRRTGETTTAARTLGEAAELYFSEHSLHDEDVEWDAWRRPDGRWALVATYAVAGKPRTAEFTHDQPGRYVVADNDDAKLLTGELRAPDEPGAAPRVAEASPELGAQPGRAPPRRRRDPAGPRHPQRRRGAPRPTRPQTPPTPTGSPSRSARTRRRAAHRGVRRGAGRASRRGTRDRGDRPPTTRPPQSRREARTPGTLRGTPRGEAGRGQAQGPLLGPVLGRDHVRRQRQGRLTGLTWSTNRSSRQLVTTRTSARGGRATLLVSNIRPTA